MLLHDIPNIRKAKKAIKKAFTYQLEKKGFTMIEVISTCPVNWGMKPREALDWAKEHMFLYLGLRRKIMIEYIGFGRYADGQLIAQKPSRSIWDTMVRNAWRNCKLLSCYK